MGRFTDKALDFAKEDPAGTALIGAGGLAVGGAGIYGLYKLLHAVQLRKQRKALEASGLNPELLKTAQAAVQQPAPAPPPQPAPAQAPPVSTNQPPQYNVTGSWRQTAANSIKQKQQNAQGGSQQQSG